MQWRTKALLAVSGLLALGLAGPVYAAPATPHNPTPVDLDVMFIGAHPDDEAGQLGMFGYWNENHDINVGVITMTRGEGGGNAVGLEEGPDLGILREAEERKAVGWAHVEHIYNLDALDFYYTASAPLSKQIWGYYESLSRIVRVLRTTKPEVIITMNPSATQGNHGNHQQAAMLAVEAFYAAADPNAFPEQITQEGLQPFRVARLFQAGGSGSGASGQACETSPFRPSEPTNVVFGTWTGYESAGHDGTRWNQVNVWARREYASQGWGNTGNATTNPASIGCNRITMIDSRTPYPDPTAGGTAALQGTSIRAEGGLPLGTELHVRPGWEVLSGVPFSVDVNVRAGDTLTGAKVDLEVPAGWTVTGGQTYAKLKAGQEAVASFTVTPAADLVVGQRFRVKATMTTDNNGSGSNTGLVQATAPVRGTLEPLPEVGNFREWTVENKVQSLDALIPSILPIASGGTRTVRVDLKNYSKDAQSGEVALNLPAGFTVAESSRSYSDLAPGAKTSVTFTVTNSDATLPTANRAPNDGAYQARIVTGFNGGSATENGVFNLVPVTTIPKAATAPTVDGTASAGEYTGEAINISSLWEGSAVTAADLSGTARVTYTDDALHVFVTIADDVMGKPLLGVDCKRPRRADSVEIGIDPRNDSANTSTVFNVAVFPITDDPANGNPPCFARERDNRQGGPATAPGLQVASHVNSPYTGYQVEVKIPFNVLPDNVDPAKMGLNILVNDSDTQDLSTQSRIGWSTWSGVRADPYRWGVATLPGLPNVASAPKAPVMPDTAARSVNSPQTILQSATDGVAPGGWTALDAKTLRIEDITKGSDSVDVQLKSKAAGTARIFIWDGSQVLSSEVVSLGRNAKATVRLPLGSALPAGATLLVSYESGNSTLGIASAL